MPQGEKVVDEFLRFAVDWRLMEIKTDVETDRAQWCVIPDSTSCAVTEIRKADVRQSAKDIARVIEKSSADILDWKPGHGKSVFEIPDGLRVTSAFGTRLVEFVSAKRRRTAGEKPFGDWNLLRDAARMNPSHPQRG